MAHNRLEKIGTIYSRITGLVRAGAMKLEDRPMWYEVYQAFPPKEEPMYGKPVPQDVPIRKIFYPEDVIRAKFHKKVSNLPAVNLSDTNNQTICQKCVELTERIAKDKGTDVNSAFDEAFSQLKAEAEASRKPQPQKSSETFNVQQIMKDT